MAMLQVSYAVMKGILALLLISLVEIMACGL